VSWPPSLEADITGVETDSAFGDRVALQYPALSKADHGVFDTEEIGRHDCEVRFYTRSVRRDEAARIRAVTGL